MNTTRPMYWSVQRELWENRSVYIAPLLVVAVFLFGFVISTIGMPQRRPATLKLSAEKQRAAIGQPYDVAAIALTITSFIVGLFYCLDALHGERRDRSILFWKSMPVSDLTTVLSKASIPLVVLPLSYLVSNPQENVNWVYGFGQNPQKILPGPLFVILLMLLFPLVAYLPTHLLFTTIFRERAP